MERVALCQDCRMPSTADIRGVRAFKVVIRGGNAIEVCKACYDLDTIGARCVVHKLSYDLRTRRKDLVDLPLGSREREDVFVEILNLVDITDDPGVLGRVWALVERITPGGVDRDAVIHSVAEKARK
jgi:hypothetical protein